MTITVLLADDEPLVRGGLRALLSAEPEITVVGEVADGVDVLKAVGTLRPDIVLMDVRMPRMDGIEATRRLTAVPGQHTKVLVVTTFENDEFVYDAMRAGASGFLLKRAQPEEIVYAIRTVAAGESLLFPTAVRRLIAAYGAAGTDRVTEAGLTGREREVLRLVATGQTNAEIAETLFLGLQTVKTHVRSVLTKLGVRGRVQAVIAAFESGFVTAGDSDRPPRTGR
jgi:DNA-binding NarL/FixJ family response regulator